MTGNGNRSHKSLRQDILRIERIGRVLGFGNWEIDLQSKKVTASDAARAIYGLEGDHWSLATIQGMPLEEYRALLDDALHNLIEHGQPYNVEFKIRRPSDGAIADVQSVAEYDAAAGKVFGVIKDITEQKRAENALRDSEHRYRLIAEKSTDVIWTLSLDGRFTYVSPSVYELRGYTPDEVLRQSIEEAVCPGSLSAVAQGMKLAAAEIMTGDRQGPAPLYEVEQPRKDGTTVWTEVSASLVYDEGRPSHILGVSRDITERKRTEDALREREGKLDAIFRTAPVGIAVAVNRIIKEVNDTICRMAGYTRQELIGQSTRVLYDDVAAYESMGQTIQDELTARGQFTTEINGRRKDGSHFPMILSVTPLDASDPSKGIVFTALDTSESARVEAALRESLSELSATLESTADGILVVGLGRKVQRYSSRFAKMWGIPKQLLEQGDDPELIKFVRGQLIDDQGFVRRIDEILDQPELSSTDSLLLKDGRVFERYSRPLRLEGKIVGRVWSFRDETERKRMELRLVRAAQEWRSTFNAIATPISIQDANFKIVRVNKAFAEALKTTPEALVGKTCYQVSHGSSEPVTGCPHVQTIKKGVPAEVEIHDADKGTYTLVSTYPMFGPSGDVIATVHISQDITERKRMQEKLMVTDRLASVGELAAGIAHEINNPLTGVLGFSELVLSSDIPAGIRQDVQTIHSEARRAAEVVKNLLVFARRHSQVRQNLLVSEVIDKVLALRAYEQKTNNISVTTEYDANLPEIEADYFQLQQVFLNIVINAEFFMAKSHGKGNLLISTNTLPDMGGVRITFSDDGPGIPAETLSKLFDPFFTTKDVGQGTGLGLSISHGIIQGHGGRIWAESELGKGATFFIDLPLFSPASS
ncbi:PAS domain S-box-containing protein [Dehalogenimonas formicexedens]|uniref:histidine kinase n=1 Tax=Dehalogenimonas formicexedens TaxID=1839801 RepID=A0A1P8F814_9CHLR|nr:PAS domain S-box protein [Dehalogenimonas formicexedens]APV44614.1 PAS domain S-box-containing protein [Dehalogenimonas formicexedens]